MVFVCRGQPPFRVLLACGRSCCYGLSHFLLLTFPCWHSSVHSVISFILFLSIPSFTPLSPTARNSWHSFAHCVPFHSFHFQGICLFPPINPCGCSRVPFHSTKLHHPANNPFSFITLHYSTFVLFIQPLPFPPHRSGKKNAPNQLPAAPVHRAPRFLCPGHSLHSHRLAHNAQAEYFVPFLYTRFSALLSTHAQGCFYYSV